MRRSLLALFILLIGALAACSQLGAPEPTPTATLPPTETPIPSVTPSETPEPTNTPLPTPKFTPTPLSPETILARNNPVVQERGKVELEVVRFLIGEKDVVLSDHPQLAYEEIAPPDLSAPSFDDKQVVGEIILRITNKQTERIITLFLSDLIIATSGQQIRLEEFILEGGYFGDDINPFNPDILPETSVLAGFWFAFDDLDIAEITKVNIALDEPYYSIGNTYYPLGSRYFMSVEFSERIFEPLLEAPQ